MPGDSYLLRQSFIFFIWELTEYLKEERNRFLESDFVLFVCFCGFLLCLLSEIVYLWWILSLVVYSFRIANPPFPLTPSLAFPFEAFNSEESVFTSESVVSRSPLVSHDIFFTPSPVFRSVCPDRPRLGRNRSLAVIPDLSVESFKSREVISIQETPRRYQLNTALADLASLYANPTFPLSSSPFPPASQSSLPLDLLTSVDNQLSSPEIEVSSS